MKKITEGIYVHRGHDIIKDKQGIWVAGILYLFPTLSDARAYIDKIIDGTNKKVPVISGEWSEQNY